MENKKKKYLNPTIEVVRMRGNGGLMQDVSEPVDPDPKPGGGGARRNNADWSEE